MRRLDQNETLHGTRHGQLPIAAELREAYGLTEREAATAALLALGIPPARIASRLGIAASTCEKHVSAVRAKIGAGSATECVAALARFSAERSAGIPAWPPHPSPDVPMGDARDRRLAAGLRGAHDLATAVGVLRDELGSEGVGGVYFVFLPQNAASFRRGDAIEQWAAPEPLVRAFEREGGLTKSPIAARLFAEPDRHLVIHGTDAEVIERDTGLRLPGSLLSACRDAGFGHSIAFGSPFGCGFVGASIFFARDPRGASSGELEALIHRMRSALLLTQSSVFAYGILARTADLTVRERDALSLLAQGHDQAAIAERLACGQRSVSKTLRGARVKLGAATNPEAVSRAMALNALVFL